eukprot:4361102-Pyramimonas_sp.AAC.1
MNDSELLGLGGVNILEEVDAGVPCTVTPPCTVTLFLHPERSVSTSTGPGDLGDRPGKSRRTGAAGL